MRTCLVAGAASLLRLGSDRRGATARTTATAAAAGPAAARGSAADSASRPSSAPASTSSASTSSSPTRTATRSPICKQSDFEVTEDGKPQTIETFKLIKLDGGTAESPNEPPRPIRTDFDEETEAARDDVRLFAIFLDDYHVRRGASLAVRGPLAQFIDTQLGPSDMVGVMYPLRVDRIGADDAQSFGRVTRTAEHFSAASTTTSRRTSSRSSTRTTRPKRSSRSAIRCRSRRSRG